MADGNKRVSVWFRLGASVNLSIDELRRLKAGDTEPLKDALAHGMVQFGGNTYIPQACLENETTTDGEPIPQDIFKDGDIEFGY